MRIRPRFSIRTLAVLLTLVCLYFGGWSLTDRFGIPALTSKYDGFRFAHSPTPLFVYVDSNEIVESRDFTSPAGQLMNTRVFKRDWHLWLFGVSFKLPYESTWSEDSAVPITILNID